MQVSNGRVELALEAGRLCLRQRGAVLDTWQFEQLGSIERDGRELTLRAPDGRALHAVGGLKEQDAAAFLAACAAAGLQTRRLGRGESVGEQIAAQRQEQREQDDRVVAVERHATIPRVFLFGIFAFTKRFKKRSVVRAKDVH